MKFNQVDGNEVLVNPREGIFVAEYEDYDIIEDSLNDTKETTEKTFCCCIPEADPCNDPSNEQDLVSQGGINVRIVNREPEEQHPATFCQAGLKICCQDLSVDLSVFGRSTCTPPQPVVQQSPEVSWTQGCLESPVRGPKECGTRLYDGPAKGLAYGESSPGEFPWTCLILSQTNDFIGSCVVIPNDSRNDNNLGTRKVLTAAHKLNGVGPNE